MDEINVIFGGSMTIALKTQGKKLEREISLVQHIEPEKRMKWSDIDISCRPEDHPETELSNRNLPFMVKLPIGQHKVAKTLIDNEASLNLIMRKTFIEMGLNMADLTPVHDTFHGYPGTVVHSHWMHRPRGILWNGRQQEPFPPEVYGGHPHYLCHNEDA
jgi:hypothetical protein